MTTFRNGGVIEGITTAVAFGGEAAAVANVNNVPTGTVRVYLRDDGIGIEGSERSGIVCDLPYAFSELREGFFDAHIPISVAFHEQSCGEVFIDHSVVLLVNDLLAL